MVHWTPPRVAEYCTINGRDYITSIASNRSLDFRMHAQVTSCHTQGTQKGARTFHLVVSSANLHSRQGMIASVISPWPQNNPAYRRTSKRDSRVSPMASSLVGKSLNCSTEVSTRTGYTDTLHQHPRRTPHSRVNCSTKTEPTSESHGQRGGGGVVVNLTPELGRDS